MTPRERAAEIVLNAGGFRECGSLVNDIERALLDTIEEAAQIAEKLFRGRGVDKGLEDRPEIRTYWGNVAAEIRALGEKE